MARFDWRREDTIYAAATAVAAAFIAFLVAGTFGLVQSPFGSATIARPPQLTTLAARAAAQSAEATPSGTAAPTTAPTATPDQPVGDRSAPSATITSEPGASLSVTEGSTVTGAARDDSSGVRDVIVVFDDAQGQTTPVAAQVKCDDTKRTTCTWTAEVPSVAGSYTVTPHAVDRAGNVGQGQAQEITVVNVGGPVEDLLGGVGSLVGGLGATLLG